MPSWNKLRIGIYQARINRIQKEREDFPNCDEEGNIIEAEKRTREYKPPRDIYKLVNGQPRRKLKRTSEIDIYELVDSNDMKNLIVETYYLVDCEKLKKDLIKKKKIIKTFFTHGNGYKIYEAYITPYKNFLIMVLGFGRIEEQICELLQDYIPQHERDKIMDSDKVKRTTEKEMVELYIQGIKPTKKKEVIKVEL
jgi:hypothetical protein